MSDSFTEQLQSDNKKLLDENKKLSEENKRLSISSSQIADSINSSKIEIESLNASKSKIEVDIKHLESSIKECSDFLISIESELSTKNSDLKQLEFKIKESESKYFDMIKASNNKLNDMRADFDSKIAEYSEQEKVLKDSIARLTQRLEDTKVLITNCEHDFDVVKQRCDASISDLNRVIDTKTLTIKTLTKENEEIEEKIANNKVIFDEINQLKNLSVTLSENKTALEKEISDISTKLPDLNSQKEKIEAEIESLKNDKKTAESEYSVAKNKLFALAEKEREISEKEEFIRSKFQEAGLSFE